MSISTYFNSYTYPFLYQMQINYLIIIPLYIHREQPIMIPGLCLQMSFIDPLFQNIQRYEEVPLQANLKDVRRKNSGRGRPKGERNVKKSEEEKRCELASGGKKMGHWSEEENKKYHWFLEIYNYHFLNKHLRRTDKIFKTMETFIGSRQAEQCRSHHQKMQKKYDTFEKILLHLRKRYYGTQNHMPVEEDLKKNEINIGYSLVESDKLMECISQGIKYGEGPANTNNGYLQMDMFHIHEESKGLENIFNDRYENQIDLLNFMK